MEITNFIESSSITARRNTTGLPDPTFGHLDTDCTKLKAKGSSRFIEVHPTVVEIFQGRESEDHRGPLDSSSGDHE